MLPVRANIPKPRNRQPLQPTSQLRGMASSASKGRLNRSTVIEENNYPKEVKRGRAHNLSISHTRASVADSESTSVDNTQLATRPATRSLGHGPSDGLRMSIDSPFTEVSNLVTDGNDVKGHLEIQSVDSSFTNLDGSEANGTPQRASCPIIQSQSSLFSKHRRLFPSLNQSSMQDLMAISKPPATDLSINPPSQQLNFPSQDTPTSNKPEYLEYLPSGKTHMFFLIELRATQTHRQEEDSKRYIIYSSLYHCSKRARSAVSPAQ